MACDKCSGKCNHEKLKCIPYAAYEIALEKAERTSRRLAISLVLSLTATVVCVILGVIF